jgi:multiple sugar transport system ATP-binding protein
MNMLEGHIADGAFHGPGGIRWPLPPGAPASGEVIYGIRPEHLRLDPAGLPATIQVVEPTGSETQVLLRIGESSLLGAFRERIPEGHGASLPVSPDIPLVHLFDKKTGQRI